MNINLKKLWPVLGVAMALLVWFFWPSSEKLTSLDSSLVGADDGEELVSSIQPVTNLDATRSSTESLTDEAKKTDEVKTLAISVEDQEAFKASLAATNSGDHDNAKGILTTLIKRRPDLLEPYINLASLQTAEGELEAARATLMQGLSANPNYRQLFDGLQQVHAALAADAYKLALAANEQERSAVGQTSINLPVASALNHSVAPEDRQKAELARQQLTKLQARLSEQQKLAEVANGDLVKASSEVAKLRQQLTQANSELSAALSTNSSDESDRAQLTQQIESLRGQLDERERSFEQQLANRDNDLSVMRTQLADNQSTIQSLQQRLNDAVQVVAAVEPSIESEGGNAALGAVNELHSQEKTPSELAQARVLSWAQAWSNQDVASYISHYADDYTPLGSGLSRRSWLDQRQERLTNKRFIRVNLSQFMTQVRGDQIIVTFIQRYQANTLDDTIQKALTLEARDGDWSNAKIVSERVIR